MWLLVLLWGLIEVFKGLIACHGNGLGRGSEISSGHVLVEQ
jgi:hypothetical protein